MKNIKTIQVDWEEIISIECDKCKVIYDKNNWAEFQEIVNIKFKTGYGSIFGDSVQISLNICQYCFKIILDEHFNSIKFNNEN